jgi:hypothetical protein
MSTNFYLCHVPTVKEHIEMQELLAKKQYEELKNKIEEATHQYHIGKRSYGWQFLFEAGKGDANSNFEYYVNNPWANNLLSLKEWLSKPEYIIKDEYGTFFTAEQFWNEEVGESLYNNPDKYINCKQYYKDNPRYFDNREFTSSDGLRFSISEFC